MSSELHLTRLQNRSEAEAYNDRLADLFAIKPNDLEISNAQQVATWCFDLFGSDALIVITLSRFESFASRSDQISPGLSGTVILYRTDQPESHKRLELERYQAPSETAFYHECLEMIADGVDAEEVWKRALSLRKEAAQQWFDQACEKYSKK